MDLSILGIYGFLAIILGSIIYFVIVVTNNEIKMKQAIIDYCKNNNLKYFEKAKNIPAVAKSFSLININGHNYLDEMSGTRGNYTIDVFDYSYVTGSGKRSHYIVNTICIVKGNNIKMPKFFIRDKKAIIDSLGKLFGGQDIIFSEDTTFSNKFVLQGNSEPLIKEFFDSKIRATFSNNHIPEYKYEGDQDCFMLSAPRKLALNERINLISMAMNIFKEFDNSTNEA